MPNPFAAKPGSKKLNDPTAACPLNKGEIRIEAYSFDPRTPLVHEQLEGVGIAVTGGPTSTKSATTPADGKWRYQPLAAGNYTVTPSFKDDLNKTHDTAAVGVGLAAVNAGGVATVVILVPSTYVVFIVHDAADNLPVANLEWQLSRQPPGGAVFTKYDSGTTGPDGKVEKTKVGIGNHRLTIKTLSNPVWSAAEVVIGKEITLTADANGFEVGTAGTFKILDGRAVTTVLATVPATVKAGPAPGTFILQAKYTPAAGAFTNLKHSRISFLAEIGAAAVYSAPLTLHTPEAVQFDDANGKSVDRQVELRFSGGSDQTVTTVKGKVDIKIPWAETLLAVRLPGLNNARVKIGDGGVIV